MSSASGRAFGEPAGGGQASGDPTTLLDATSPTSSAKRFPWGDFEKVSAMPASRDLASRTCCAVRNDCVLGRPTREPTGGASGASSCETIQADYAAALDEAASCRPSAPLDECTERLVEGLACERPRYVNASKTDAITCEDGTCSNGVCVMGLCG